MQLLFGVVIGILISILLIIVLFYFRHPIVRGVSVAETILTDIAPRPRGFICNPLTELQESRNEIIERNRSQGLDTNVKDLYED